MYQKAIAEFQDALARSGGNSRFLGALGHAYAISGKRSDAQRIVDGLRSQQPQLPAYDMATVYAGLGDKDKAFESLEKACEQHDFHLAFSFNVNPMFDSLRSDARFTTLVRRMDFPQ